MKDEHKQNTGDSAPEQIDKTNGASSKMRNFSTLHTDVWRVVFENPVLFVILPVVVWFPFDLLAEYVAQASSDDYFSNLRAYHRVSKITGFFIGSWIAAIMMEVLSKRAYGLTMTLGTVIVDGSKHYGRVLGVMFSAGWRVGIATLLLIIPGIYLAIQYALALPVAIFENMSGRDALEKSQDYMTGRGWKLLKYIITGTMIYLPGLFGFFAFLPEEETPLQGALSTMPVNVFGILLLIALVMIYADATGSLELARPVGTPSPNRTQRSTIQEQSENNPSIRIALILSILLFSAGAYKVITAPLFEGEKMTFGNLQHEIYYTKDIDQSEVQKLGEVLIEIGYFDDEVQLALQLTKSNATFDNLYIYIDKEYWMDKDVLEYYKFIEDYLLEIDMARPIRIIMIEETFSGREEMPVRSAYQNLSDSESFKGEEEAIRDYNKAIELDPNNVDAYGNRGDAYVKLGKYEEAIRDYNKAIELDPKSKWAYHRLGWTYMEMELLDKSITAYKKSIELDMSFSASYGNLGWVYYLKGDYQKCIEYSEEAVSLDSTALYAKYNIALSYLCLGQIEKAKRLYAETKQYNLSLEGEIRQGAIDDLKELIEKDNMAKEARMILIEIFSLRNEELEF